MKEIVKKLLDSNHLPDGVSLDNESLRLSETVVVGGNWYWKSKGKCWTQPTDKSSPRKEIEEKEYRDACSKAKNGISDMSDKKETKSGKNASKYTAESIKYDWKLIHDITGKYPARGADGQQLQVETSEEASKAHESMVEILKSNGVKVVSEKDYKYVGNISNMSGAKFKITTFEDSEGNKFSVRSRTGGIGAKQLVQLQYTYDELSDSWKEVADSPKPTEPTKDASKNTDPKKATPPKTKSDDVLKQWKISYHENGVSKSFIVQAKTRDEAEQIGWSRVDVDSFHLREV